MRSSLYRHARIARPASRAARARERSLGQSLVELAIVTPVLLLVFAGAADLGRVFYAYVAIENATKEGAFFGSRSPLCDDASAPGCANPNNVRWRVQSELREQRVRDLAGNELVPTVQCFGPGGTPRGDLKTCTEGDMYSVSLTYPYRPLTPILGNIVGQLNVGSTSQAVVLNLAFDPTPGASVQKFVSPIGAKNASDVTSKCLEPDDTDAEGYYRSPCLDSSTSDPTDRIKLRFEQGATIAYRVRVGNSGGQSLTGVSVTDSRGSTGCSFPSSMPVGFVQVCDYVRVAPNVSGSGNEQDYVNVATIDSAQTLPVTSDVTVAVERPPARLQVGKWVSPFEEGDDGDGDPNFGFIDDLTITYSTEVPGPEAWFKIIVRNTGGRTATGLQITDSRGALPNTSACPSRPTTLQAGVSYMCRYRVPFSSASPATTSNTASATATNVVTDGDDSHTAIVRVAACIGTDRTVPDLIDLTKTQAQSAWTAAGFTGTLVTWSGNNGSRVETQDRPAYSCVPRSSTMTVTR